MVHFVLGGLATSQPHLGLSLCGQCECSRHSGSIGQLATGPDAAAVVWFKPDSAAAAAGP